MKRDRRKTHRAGIKRLNVISPSVGGKSQKALLFIAFALIYVVWGSTYLAMRFALEAIPPFLMIGIRFLIAGSILYHWARFQGASKPTRKHWWNATIIGILLPAFGTGGVAWAEQFVPTGISALLFSTMPMWMILIDAFRPGGTRPNLRVMAGLIAGFIGVALLIGPGILTEQGKNVDPVGAAVLIAAAISWAGGSIFSRHAILPPVPFQTAGMEMLVGGTLMTTLGLLLGEGSRIHLATLSARSLLSLLYLIIFGSLITYVAYIWLLKKTSAAAVSTYAYVNPMVAIFLGWWLAEETIGLRLLLAATIIIGSVAVIIGQRERPSPRTSTFPRIPEVQTGNKLNG
jgi:drug/metabolite transporter (DMT)-like permease